MLPYGTNYVIDLKSTNRVPNLELDLLPLDVDHASTELDADGEIVHRLEPLVRELEQQARLAHPWAICCVLEKPHSSGFFDPPVSPMMMYLNR